MTAQDGRVALVTGAARGIGAATVRALWVQGHRVLALDACTGTGAFRGAGVDCPLADRADEPEEVAALIAFCCSPSGGVANGAVLSAEGGFRG